MDSTIFPTKVGSAIHLSVLVIYFEINDIDYIWNICTPQIDSAHQPGPTP